MEIYKTPEFLIVHLKRFSYTRNSYFGSRKLGTFVDFPVVGLDLTSMTITKSVDENGKPMPLLYDLYAVSNHFGSLGAGHYTASCLNVVYNKWFDFDDKTVSAINTNGGDYSKIVHKAAYVLFYRLRKQK